MTAKIAPSILAADLLHLGDQVAAAEQGGADRGYRLESVGGAQERYDAMLENKYAGCLLNSPFEGLLRARGYRLLDTAIAVLGKYQGQVAAARKAWANANRDTVVGFTRAFVGALAWLRDPRNREEAVAIYLRNTPGADAAAAATAHAILFDPARGFPVEAAIDPDALAKVIELRSRYGRPPRALGAPSDYYDTSFLAEAVAGESGIP